MSPITVLATGDNHFDTRSDRWDECLRVHDNFVAEAQARRPNLITFGGDFYERASNQKERDAVFHLLRRCAEIAPVVGVKGNHDPDLETAIFDSIKGTYPVTVIDRAGVVTVDTAAGLVDVACLAWPEMAGAIDDGAVREAVRDVLRGLGAELAAAPLSRRRLFLGHVDMSGSVNGKGQPLIGGSVRLALADLGLVGAHAYVLSHIHMAQEWVYQGCPVAYCGSGFRTRHGENEDKSFLWVHLPPGGTDERAAITRIPSGARPMLEGVAAWDPDGPGWSWEGEPLGDVTQADVKFRYEAAADHMATARREAGEVRERLLAAGAASVALDPKTTAVVRGRAPEVALAKSVEDKLVAYWKATDTEPAPERKARLLGRLAQLQDEARQAKAPAAPPVKKTRSLSAPIQPAKEVTS